MAERILGINAIITAGEIGWVGLRGPYIGRRPLLRGGGGAKPHHYFRGTQGKIISGERVWPGMVHVL